MLFTTSVEAPWPWQFYIVESLNVGKAIINHLYFEGLYHLYPFIPSTYSKICKIGGGLPLLSIALPTLITPLGTTCSAVIVGTQAI